MASDPLIGSTVAGYRIESRIGHGGMSRVYRAEHLRLGRRDALKLLSLELMNDGNFRERFEREWRVAAGIEHPNIIPVFDAGEADGHFYIAMRYVETTDLHALLEREGPLEPARAASIIGQTASALDAAHDRGLVHRDIKPGNILITAGDHVFLSDFGLAKLTAADKNLTTDGLLRRHRRLCGARADPGQRLVRRPHGRVRPRLRRLRVPLGRAALPARVRPAAHVRAPAGSAAAHHRRPERRAGDHGSRAREGACEVEGGSLRDLRRVRGRHDRGALERRGPRAHPPGAGEARPADGDPGRRSGAGGARRRRRGSSPSSAAPTTIPRRGTAPAPSAALFQDSFADPASGWFRYTSPAVRLRYADGAYEFLVKAPNWRARADTAFSPDASSLGNVTVAAVAADRGSAPGSYGVLCRSSGSGSYYALEIGADGVARIGKVSGGQFGLLGTANVDAARAVGAASRAAARAAAARSRPCSR